MSLYTAIREKGRSLSKTGLGQLPLRLISAFYRNFVRKLLPKVGEIHYSDIKISNDKRVFDSYLSFPFVPKASKDKPTYEQTLVNELNKYVKEDSKVVIVGAGVGITAVVCDNLISDNGEVISYESSLEQYKKAKRTFKYNSVSKNTSLINATVAEDIGVYNEGSSKILPVSEIPICDILQLDCEGAEKIILQEMIIKPKIIIVETHGLFGSPTDLIIRILSDKGYSVRNMGVAEPRIKDQCLKGDIMVLTGILDEDHGS